MRELPKDEKKQNIWSSSTTSERGENMYKFYGWETADITDARGLTPRDCYDIFSRVWCAETCAPRMRASWTPENKTLGQCSVTAFLVQDIYGGEVRGVPQKNGTFHCFNVVGDCVFDLTSEQFGDEKLCYEGCPVQEREVHFLKEEKRLRYELLKERLGKEIIMEFTTDIFRQFDKKWALLTAGSMESFNTMTVSWGGLGTIWGKPVATVYVRTSRYTHEFMDGGEYFTVSFYPEEFRKTLGILGSKSGRDMDKMHESGLTPKAVGETVTFEEAEVTLLCRKLFKQPLELANMSEELVSRWYGKDAPHDMYIGEVLEIN